MRFEGWVTRERLSELLRAADVGIVAQKASPYSHLVHTNKMVDYWIFGLPTIASRLRSVSSAYDDSVLEYFEPGDAASLAEAIRRLHDNPGRRAELARNGRAALAFTGWGAQEELFLEVYDSLLRGYDPVRRGEFDRLRTFAHNYCRADSAKDTYPETVTDTPIPVAIIGAGPYGLAAAAHLRGGGATVRMFGPTMSFWSEMPRGMLLRSPYVASTIGNPTGSLSLDAYGTAIGRKITKPVPLQDFVEYGRWFAGHFASEHDERARRQDRAGRRRLPPHAQRRRAGSGHARRRRRRHRAVRRTPAAVRRSAPGAREPLVRAPPTSRSSRASAWS